MSSIDRPQPAPVTDSLAALIGNLDDLLAIDGSVSSLGEAPYGAALDNLRAVAAACGIDWDDVLAEHDRRSVVAE